LMRYSNGLWSHANIISPNTLTAGLNEVSSFDGERSKRLRCPMMGFQMHPTCEISARVLPRQWIFISLPCLILMTLPYSNPTVHSSCPSLCCPVLALMRVLGLVLCLPVLPNFALTPVVTALWALCLVCPIW
jgi:hypothetical protein